MVVNNNEYVYRHIDEASIKKVEADREIRLKQLEIEERDKGLTTHFRKILFYLWVAAIIIVAVFCILSALTSGLGFITVFDTLFFIGIPVVGGGAYLLFKVIPERDEDKVARANGGIRFPSGYEPFNQQHYDTIVTALRASGFTNISTVSMHDVKLGIFEKRGRVEKVAVNGKNILLGGHYYDRNVPIVITYHGA